MKEYLDPLIQRLNASKNEERAGFAKKYLKNQFEFLGMDTKTRRNIIKEFLAEYGTPPVERLKEFSFYLWNLSEREFQHTAIDVLRKMKKTFREGDIHWIEQLIIQKSWWDTVDGLAGWVVGAYFQLYPENIKSVTQKWMDSENIWLERTSLIFQLNYKENTDTALLSEYILCLAHRKEFWIRKAIGWALREYSKTNKKWVKEFIGKHKLSPLSYREASKYV